MQSIRRRLPVALLVIALAGLAACSAGAAGPDPSQSPDPARSENSGSATAPPTAERPGDGVLPGGGAPGQPGDPELVVPRPGQQLVQRVGASLLDARTDGRHVVLNVRFWSGVEPCSVLNSVDVTRVDRTIDVALHVGTSDPDAMCIAIAVEKVVVVDLGELDPGTYTVTSDEGEAEPITVVVS